jgi:uncharacterized protein involved in exopolysaccharide biosynthesis
MLATCLVCTFLLPERYRAAVRIRGSWEDDLVSRRSGPHATRRRLQDVRSRILSRATLEGVLAKTQDGQPAGDEAASADVRAMLDAVAVKPEGPSDYRIEYVHRDPLKAALVANTVATVIVEQAQMERLRREEASPARIRPRLVEARRSMDEIAGELHRLRGGSSFAATRGRPAASRMEELDRESRAVSNDLMAARDRADRLRQAIEAQAPVQGAERAGASGELEQLRTEMSRLRERYTEEHPDVQELQRRIRELEITTTPPKPVEHHSPLADLEAELAALEREIEALEEKGRILDAERARLPRAAADEPQPGRSLEALVAEYDKAQASYLALLEESRQAEIASASLGPVVRFGILESARVPQAPYFPDSRLFAIGGLVFGVALGLGLALVAEARDHSIKGPEDLEEALPQPLLAQIPFVSARHPQRRT